MNGKVFCLIEVHIAQEPEVPVSLIPRTGITVVGRRRSYTWGGSWWNLYFGPFRDWERLIVKVMWGVWVLNIQLYGSVLTWNTWCCEKLRRHKKIVRVYSQDVGKGRSVITVENVHWLSESTIRYLGTKWHSIELRKARKKLELNWPVCDERGASWYQSSILGRFITLQLVSLILVVRVHTYFNTLNPSHTEYVSFEINVKQDSDSCNAQLV